MDWIVLWLFLSYIVHKLVKNVNAHAAFTIATFFIMLLNLGSGVAGYTRPGFFESHWYVLSGVNGQIYFPMSGNYLDATFDIKRHGSGASSLVNVRNRSGQVIFADGKCQTKEIGDTLFVCLTSPYLKEELLPSYRYPFDISIPNGRNFKFHFGNF